jgi:hypothetical protein
MHQRTGEIRNEGVQLINFIPGLWLILAGFALSMAARPK